ncbi:synaptic vesicle glycoprotein 2B-like isoform X1 [Maniola hyperantus]|uniref:synaptic vesicle glycoprotein 2B-like isoform X1 n=1 Tax=Aphantopus hyperantus TaxID=2795564 RepID=UPI0021221FC7
MNCETEKFITEIQQKETIWNCEGAPYNNRDLKQKQWDELEDTFGKEEIKKEKKSLTQQSKADGDAMKILEDALTLCKFGKFHILLLAASLCSIFAAMLVTTTSSYILPVAECDLDMTIMYKGLLIAIPFLGQIGASLFTGFLVDTFGRKIFLIGGNVGIFIGTLLEGSSQTYWMLIFIKLIEGISISLSFSAISTMLSEFTPIGLRDRVLLSYAGFTSTSLIVSALLAWAALPLPIHVVVWEGYFVLHSWNVYLYICSIWSFMAIVMYYCLPESPKFLLSHAREEEALEVLKTIYSTNTGNDRDSFPILSFNTATGTLKPTDEISLKKQLVNAFIEVKELFRRPLIYRLLLFSFLTFAGLIVFTSLRLWYPQISTIIENYSKNHGETAQFCVMIDDYMDGLQEMHLKVVPANMTEASICVPKLSGTQTYLNGIILGCVSLVFVVISAFIVELIGQRLLMFVILILCALCSASLYWTNQSLQIAILMSATCGLLQTALSLQQNMFVRVFPTTSRALAVSIIIMVGRIGSLAGNIIFPILLSLGCMAPFITTSLIAVGLAGLVYFLPDVNKNKEAGGDK